MRLKFRVKDIGLTTGGPYVVIFGKEDAEELDLHALDRIKLVKGKRHLTVAVDISDKGVRKGDIGLFDEVLDYLKLKQGDKVEVRLDKRPDSLVFIKEKLEGKKLNEKEIRTIVDDIVVNHLNVVELTYFVAGCYSNGLSLNESVYLTKALSRNGGLFKFGKIILGKHCIGGVPGNRTSMIIVPVMTALGYIMPKTSSRAITSAAGTADTMEVLAPVDLNADKIKKVVRKTKGCLIWGGARELANADNNIINVERLLSLDPQGVLLASIIAKQKIMGVTHLLIDIPIGKDGKVKTYAHALRLKAKFMLMGRRLGMKIKVIVTDGSQPIGNGVGPVLEVRDVIGVLKGDGPNDLKNKSIELAAALLRMVGIWRARKKVVEVLDNGNAYDKFIEIIKEQGGKLDINLRVGRFNHTIKATKRGIIREINNKEINKIARMLGSPKSKGSGIYFYFKKNARVRKNDSLFILYSDNKERLDHAVNYLRKEKILVIE